MLEYFYTGDEMKKLSKILSIILSVAFCFAFSSCAKNNSLDLYYFNTQIHISTRSKSISNDNKEKIKSLFSSLEKEFSVGNNNSVINKFNELSVGQSTEISERVTAVLNLANDCYNFSDGKFNPAVFPLVKLWGFYPNYPILNFTPPTDEQILQTTSNFTIDFSKVKIDTDNNTIVKTCEIQIDLGGILKGYALDECAKILKESGHTDGYISIGNSSVYILGTETLGIKHPRPTQNLKNIISVNVEGQKNLAVSTSGDYQKTYTYNGKTYSHIIDGRTGKPAQTGIVSATLISNKISGGMLDGLSTALSLCSHTADKTDTELFSLINKVLSLDSECKIFIIFIDGENKILLTNQKQGEDFTLLDNEYTIKNA